jgi:ATP-dependent Clp protease ATP-binding subunit ClpA
MDEIEKAHPDLFNILLQVMDHASLTDNNGKKADFRNVILIMTTNAGAREMMSENIGFAKAQSTDELFAAPLPTKLTETASKGKTALERTFSPEFRNRLDASIVFNPLSRAEILRVVDKFVEEIKVQLQEKSVSLEVTEKARQWMAVKGYDKQYGARPMARLIQQKIREPLAEELLFGQLQTGGKATADEINDDIVIKTEPTIKTQA